MNPMGGTAAKETVAKLRIHGVDAEAVPSDVCKNAVGFRRRQKKLHGWDGGDGCIP